MYMYVYTCTHTHTRRTHKHAHTYTLSVSLSRLSLPYTHAHVHTWMDPRHRIGLKTVIIKSLTSDSFLSVGVSVSDSQELAVKSNLLNVTQYLSTCVCLPDKFRLSISKSLPLCVRVFVYLIFLKSNNTCQLVSVCLTSSVCLSSSVCLCACVWLSTCVYPWLRVLECFCVSV